MLSSVRLRFGSVLRYFWNDVVAESVSLNDVARRRAGLRTRLGRALPAHYPLAPCALPQSRKNLPYHPCRRIERSSIPCMISRLQIVSSTSLEMPMASYGCRWKDKVWVVALS